MPSTASGRRVPEPLGDRARADQLDPVEHARRRPGRPRGRAPARTRATAVSPATATSPRLVVQGRQQPAQRGQRVRDRAAEHAGVHRPLERADLDDEVDEPAQAGGERRHVDRRVARVGDDDDVAAQRVAVLGEQRRQRRRADLLLALEEQHDADRRPAAEGPQHGEVHEHAGLVVGGAAAVQPAVALGRPRRAGSSTPPPGRSAGRRGGRRAAPSSRPAAPARSRSRRAARPRRARPARRPRRRRWRSAAAASQARSTSAAWDGAAETVGTATIASRSARAAGISRATAARRSAVLCSEVIGRA